MEGTITKSPILLYTEQTPNPETLKFVTNKILYNVKIRPNYSKKLNFINVSFSF